MSNEADAEDILPGCVLPVSWQTRNRIEQVTAWLFTVARNKITDKQRKKKPEALEDLYASAEDEVAFDWTEIFFDDTDNPETSYLRNLFGKPWTMH